MKSKLLKLFSMLLAVSMALLPIAGCDGIRTSIPSPAASTSPQASASPDASDPVSPTEASSPSVSPSGTADASPGASASPDTSGSAPADTATASPTVSVSPTPAPDPAGSHDGDRPDVTVLKYYGKTVSNSLPEGLSVALKYDKYWKNAAPMDYLDYCVIHPKSTTVRELPNAKAKALQTAHDSDRLPLLAEVKGADGKSWYRVRLIDGKSGIGYISASTAKLRAFQVAKAFEKIKGLKAVADLAGTSRVNNYNNLAGLPEKLPGGKTEDAFGNQRDQAAPAYIAPDKTSSFRYAPDGMLCQVLGAKGAFTEVYFPFWDEVRYVPTQSARKKSYLAKSDVITTLTQAMIVDRANQNIAVFELIDGKWSIVSMSYVSTGKDAKVQKPTPMGDFFTEKHVGKKLGLGEFFYFPDGTPELDADGKQKFDGYAPYAIRFSGGAYLHGMPMNINYDATGHMILTKKTSEVYGDFLGVYPASHMCVRNYTSHAKFMYNMVKDKQASVIVIE